MSGSGYSLVVETRGKVYNNGNLFVDCNEACNFNNSGNLVEVGKGTIYYDNETVTCNDDCVYDSTTGRIKKNS